jgi:hypothetical protein
VTPTRLLFARIPRLSRAQWMRWVTTAIYLAAVVMFILSIRQFHRRSTGFTELIDFGDQFYYAVLPAIREMPRYTDPRSPGYDGQFYAQLAVEPLLRNRDIDKALDNPPYRARRILFSWTAYVFGLGRPEWVVNAYAMQNIVAWLLLAGLLLRWFPPTSARNFLPWFGCLYGIGMAASVRLALLEGPGMVIIVLAVWAMERNRPWLAAGALGLAGLGRETSLLAAGLLVDRFPSTRRQTLILIGKGVAVGLPLLLWILYIRSLYPTFNVSNPDSFSMPFSGYVERWRAILHELMTDGWWTFARFNLASMIGLTTQVVFIAWRRQWDSPWWRIGAAYCLLMPLLSILVWEGAPGAAHRVLLPVSFAFNVLVARLPNRWFWPFVILGNLSVWHGMPTLGMSWVQKIS